MTSIISGSAAPIICRSIILVKSFIRRLPRQRLMKCLKIPKQTLPYAHVHHPLMRYTTSEQLVINPGSVGEPFCDWSGLHDDPRAEYCILSVTSRDASFIQKGFLRSSKRDQTPKMQGFRILDLYPISFIQASFILTIMICWKKSTKNEAILKDVLNILKN